MDDVIRHLQEREEPLGPWFAAALALAPACAPSFRVVLPPVPPHPARFLAQAIQPLCSISHGALWREARTDERAERALVVLEDAVVRALSPKASPRQRAAGRSKTRLLREYLPSALRFFECSDDGAPAVRDFRAYVRALHHALFFVSDLVDDVRFYAELPRLEPPRAAPPVSVSARLSLDAPLDAARPAGLTWHDVVRAMDDVEAELEDRERQARIHAIREELARALPPSLRAGAEYEFGDESLKAVGKRHHISPPAVLKKARHVREYVRSLRELLQALLRGY